MSYDEMELDMIGDQKTAMFVIISDTDDTFNFVVAIMYTQLFNLLCDKADDEHGGRLPYHVRLLLDEFSNIGQIPKFDKLIATIRSREISASIILQSQSQLKTIYKDAAETITGNCDTVLFLGGKESSTLKEISETLGKETIDLYNTSDTRGTSQSYGLNYQKTGKELMSRDELAVMDGNKCILQLRGVRPFLSNKYDITKHKRYKELADADKRNVFDVEWKAEQDEVKEVLGEEYIDYNLVMATTFGNPIGTGAIRGQLKKLIEEHNLPPVVFHSLRHSSVTYKLKLNGGDIKAVQGDSGHSQVDMVTDVYSHIIDEDRRRNAELFEEAFYEKKNLDPKMRDETATQTVDVPNDVDAELLAKVLVNPEMKALVASLEKAMK